MNVGPSDAAPVVPRSGARSRSSAVTRRAVRASLLCMRQGTPGTRGLPDFLVVGAQRCGTTSLFRALSAHPSVITPVLAIKGAHYFDTHYDRPLRWYAAHFPGAPARRVARWRGGQPPLAGEASPYYLFHPAVPSRIARTLPSVRLVVLLRDPVARAVSHYHHMRFEGLEPAESLEEAIALEPGRLEGEEEHLLRDPGHVSPHHQHHGYVARGHYARQIVCLQSHFPPEQILVMDSQRLFARPERGLGRVLDFLGLPATRGLALPSLNGGSYARPAPSTFRELRSRFAPDDEELVRLLGWTPSWLQ